MLTLLKKIPFFGWVAIAVAILFLWQGLSGFAYSNKLWNMVKSEIVADKEAIIEELEKDNLANQREKEGLYQQINQLQKQRANLQQEKDRLTAKIQEIEHALQNNPPPSSDPDALIKLLHDLGLKSVRRGKK